MTARCVKCGDWGRWRAQRGCKLSDDPCKCGGKREIVSDAGGYWHNMKGDTLVLVDGGKRLVKKESEVSNG
jgi:hypothetical protein